jgi:hypothetical protein
VTLIADLQDMCRCLAVVHSKVWSGHRCNTCAERSVNASDRSLLAAKAAT